MVQGVRAISLPCSLPQPRYTLYMDQNDDYEKESLTRLVKENNRMLKAMNRREKTRGFFTFLKYVLMITFFVFSYIQLKPYLDSVMDLYQKVGEQSDSLSGITDKVGSSILKSSKMLSNNKKRVSSVRGCFEEKVC